MSALVRAFPLLVAAIALATSSIASSSSANPLPTGSFPQLFYNDTGWLDGILTVISSFDVLGTAFWNQEGPPAARLDSLRALNPELDRLAYLNPAGLSLPAVEDPGHVVNRLAAGVEDAWYVRDVRGQIVHFDQHNPTMPMMNLSNRCPRVRGKTWGEFIGDFTAVEILASGHWEGIFWDNMWSSASWVNAIIPDSLDLDLDGRADPPDSVNVWWTAGVLGMLDRFNGQVPAETIAFGNGNARHFQYMNGRYFEDFPFREGWTGSMQQAADWQLLGRPPVLLALVTRSVETDFQLMRYGLCSALLAGTASFHYAEDHPWPNPVLYDEYLVDLGQPLGLGTEVGADLVADADFETGIPPGFAPCGLGEAVWTTDPDLVIRGAGSLRGSAPSIPGAWTVFLCTDPAGVPLLPGAVYTLAFEYRVVTPPAAGGFFLAGARSDADLDGSNRLGTILDLPPGVVGQARCELRLGMFPGYYIYWGMKSGGVIVIDSIRILEGQGGAFRRDFEDGMALVNPTQSPVTLPIEPGFRRIAGVVDPITNNGERVSEVTLLPGDGLVLLADPEGPGTAVPDEGAAGSGSPASAAARVFPNPASLSATTAVRIAGVPRGGSVLVVTAGGRWVAALAAPDAGGAWRWDLRGERGQRVAAGVYLAVIRDAGGRELDTLRIGLYR